MVKLKKLLLPILAAVMSVALVACAANLLFKGASGSTVASAEEDVQTTIESSHTDVFGGTFGESHENGQEIANANYGSIGEVCYLTSDIEILGSINIENKTVNLCLNGHTIKVKDVTTPSTPCPVIIVRQGGTLILHDCNASGHGQGKITGGTGKPIPKDSSRPETDFTDTSAGGIFCYGGTLIMNGGTITGNEIKRDSTQNNYKLHGGGVNVGNGGSFTMNGGTITENSAQQVGGGVFVDIGCNFTMNGGTISNNTANSYGGGVYVEFGASNTGGKFYMNDGTITGNKAGIGDGVYSEGTFEMYGGTITGHKTQENSSGVYIDNGTTKISGGFITGNGIGINLRGGSLSMSGGIVSGNNKGVEVTKEFKVSGNPQITDNLTDNSPNNVYLPKSKVITIQKEGVLEKSAKIGVTLDDGYGENPFTTGGGAKFISNFFSDDQEKTVVKEDGELYIVGDHDHTYTSVEGQAATCTVDGWKDHYHCEECDSYFLEDGGEAVDYDTDIKLTADHNYGEKIAEKAATCNEDGYRAHYKCSVCNEYFLEKDGEAVDYDTDIKLTDPENHDYNDTVWEKNGEKHWHECSRCQAKKDEENHSWDNGNVKTEPTETEPGEKEFTCGECGQTKTESIPATGNQGGNDGDNTGGGTQTPSENSGSDNGINILGLVITLSIILLGEILVLIWQLVIKKGGAK